MQALFSPNDNVIAQAVMCRDEFGIDYNTLVAAQMLQSSSEALTLQAMIEFKPELMIQHAADWHAEEPFSSRPTGLLAMTYACTGDFGIALQWAQAGLLANLNDPGLLTTLAYILAQTGQATQSYVSASVTAGYSARCGFG